MRARILLVLLAVVAFSYQIWASWLLMHEVVFGETHIRQPFWMHAGTPVVQDVHSTAAAKGLTGGDQIIAVGGKRYEGLKDLLRSLKNAKAGDTLPVKWRQDGVEREAGIELEFTEPPDAAGKMIGLVTGFLTPFVCLVVGFGVALIRPRDHKAWIVLLMMWTFSNLATFPERIVRYFPEWIASIVVAYRPVSASLWGLSMLLFGLYFPNRLSFDQKYRWAKWLLIVPLLVNAAVSALLAYRDIENHEAFASLGALYRQLGTLPFWLNSLAVGLFFACFGWRSGTEKNPDARRRLKLIFWGMNVSLTPMFLVVLTGQILRKDPFAEFPVLLMLPVLVLLLLFPATLYYVIVVERAMDVRVVVRQGLQYALAQRGVMVLQMILGTVVFFLAANVVIDPQTNRPQRIRALSLAVLLILLLQQTAGKLRGWIDRKFFREAVNTERVLTELGDSVRTIVDTPSLVRRVADVVRETLHVGNVQMLIAGDAGYQLAYAAGDSGGEELRLPLRAKEKVLGMMVLGPKKSEEPYSKSDVRLLESVAGQTGLAIENSQLTAAVAQEVAQRERMNRELEIAEEVQQRLFPQKLPQVPGLVYGGHCRPALSIGGDYYDFFLLDGGGLGICIGDVSGKGVASALLMASLQASLRSQAATGTNDLAGMLANVNRLIFDLSPSNKYATFFYGQYDAESRRLTYVNAGHNEPFILRGSDVLRLTEGGPVIGLFRPACYRQGAVAMQSGDLLVGFTDGVSEAMNASEEEWGEDQVIAAAEKCRDGSPAEIIGELMKGADRFAAGAPQHDDMTLIVAKVI